ncbi:MAG: PepSY domain-containing protein [Crocinitomicaceae bacterium]|nr:PepSY domain-containing protein [Crocinitomicaceae bacterium]
MKKIIRNLHLTLGLITGVIVFIVAITGCLYAFREEILDAADAYRFIENRQQQMLAPSQLIQHADEKNPNKKAHAVLYYKKDRAAKVIYYSFEEDYYDIVYLNPYSGKVLAVENQQAGFFSFILDGHFYLWLPEHIGQPVVASATLIFFFIVLSGIILWWPRNKNNRSQKFKIKWNVRWRRRNYDLHSVIGFYVSWLALVFIFTGLIWGFQWFRNGTHTFLSGKQFVEYYTPESITKKNNIENEIAIDRVWNKMKIDYPNYGWLEIHTPETPDACIAANMNPDISTYWKTDYRYFDQNNLSEKNVEHQWGRFEDASKTDKLFRMNYDLHVGSIFGIAGKLIACIISLLIASLPVTGFLMWWGRRYKQ